MKRLYKSLWDRKDIPPIGKFIFFFMVPIWWLFIPETEYPNAEKYGEKE